MPPKQQQQHPQPQHKPQGAWSKPLSSGGGGGSTPPAAISKPPAASSKAEADSNASNASTSSDSSGTGIAGSSGTGSKPMNYFAALSGADADTIDAEVAAQEDQRRASTAASNGSAAAAAAAQRRQNKEREKERPGLKQPLVWIDCEMTGLDPDKDSIMQIAVICTDGSLEQVEEGPEIVVHQTEEILEGMNEWCVEQHGKSGLTQACRDSTVSLAEAEQTILQFVQQHAPDPSGAQIAGNSVHVDLAFLRRHMPRLAEHLHFRIVDVSTLGELCRRWFPREHSRAPKKKNTHTALSDIRESITQLQYYRRTIFKKWSGANLP